MLAMLLVVISVMGLIAVPAFAGQEDGYHDPAERWMNASNRTNELGVNATYTGYHWTKSCCETCGTMNANMGVSDYSFGKNVCWLYDCATAFTEYLDDVVTYEYADETYHKKIVDGGNYREFCYGTRHSHSETLEPHDLHVDILPQIDNQRFVIVKHCHDCEYTSYDFVAAKAVVADYYGVVNGQAHPLVVSDLSEAGVNAVIRYGNTAETCTMPGYTVKECSTPAKRWEA